MNEADPLSRVGANTAVDSTLRAVSFQVGPQIRTNNGEAILRPRMGDVLWCMTDEISITYNG